MRYTSCPAFGNMPIIINATKDPIAPESSFPGIPATVVVELARNISVRSLSTQRRPSGIVVQKDGQKALFIAHIQQSAFVEEI